MYPSDLKADEWLLIGSYFNARDVRGRKPRHSRKAIVDAILYVVKSGCQWRMLPKDFPPWKTVYGHFSRWNKEGVWESALDRLNGEYRASQKKRVAPSYAIIDSQSVKTIYASEDRGIDGGKKIKGRKRHIIVDTLGNLLHVSVGRANLHDTKAGVAMFERVIRKVSDDHGIFRRCRVSGYVGAFCRG